MRSVDGIERQLQARMTQSVAKCEELRRAIGENECSVESSTLPDRPKLDWEEVGTRREGRGQSGGKRSCCNSLEGCVNGGDIAGGEGVAV